MKITENEARTLGQIAEHLDHLNDDNATTCYVLLKSVEFDIERDGNGVEGGAFKGVNRNGVWVFERADHKR